MLSKPVIQPQTPKVDSSRLDAIYAQLKELQNFKDEIMGDLEDCLEIPDMKQASSKCKEFEDVVDIVVSDSR